MGTTYGTGVNPGAQTMSDVGGLVALGQKRPAIDYKPRPPLAAPPAGAAPPPPGSASVASAGDWPNDPDVAEQARKAAAAKKRYDPKADTAYDPALKIPDNSGISDPEAKSAVTTKEKDELTRKRMLAAKSAVGFDANGNPIRKTLSDPPVTYREPDPNAPTAFKAVKKKFHWPWEKAEPDAAPTGLVDDSASNDNPTPQHSGH